MYCEPGLAQGSQWHETLSYTEEYKIMLRSTVYVGFQLSENVLIYW